MRSSVRPAYRLYQWFWASLDWIYPPMCAGCGRPGTRWCSDCTQKAVIITPPYCEICGNRLATKGICRRCKDSRPPYKALRSWAYFYGPVRNALHHLKYRRDVALGEILARPMIECFLAGGWQVDMVIPVPLGVARYAERGYNQAALLARPLALSCGLKYAPKALSRTRETRSQVGLGVEQRRENVAGAFMAQESIISGKSILVVDDVATSGATLEACASALLNVGADTVYCLTLARAMGNDSKISSVEMSGNFGITGG